MLVSPIGSFITKAVCPRADWRGLGRSSADAIVCICLGERLRKLKEDIPTTRRSRGLETAHTNERTTAIFLGDLLTEISRRRRRL